MLLVLLALQAAARDLHPSLLAALVIISLSVISLSATIYGVLVFPRRPDGGFSNNGDLRLLFEGEGWCYDDDDCQHDLYCYRRDGVFQDSSFGKEFFCFKPSLGEISVSCCSCPAAGREANLWSEEQFSSEQWSSNLQK
jgi:hypothetical protein